MATIIDGKEVSRIVRQELKNEVVSITEKLNRKIGLAVILVGEDSASQIYVRNKIKACNEIGIESFSYTFSTETNDEEIISLIETLNNDDKIDGILLQLPLPKHLNENAIASRICDKKDVDGFSAYNVGCLTLGRPTYISCTPYGVLELLKRYDIELAGKNAVVVGRSNIVGKPMFNLLLAENATVTVCHSKTQNLKEITSKADILVAAIGKPKFITADMVKDGAVVIDVGINRIDGKLFGDVDFENVQSKASYITPVPGGVGPMTITMLMKNTVQSAKNKLL